MSVSNRLPAPLRTRAVARPEVVVLEPQRSPQAVNPLIRLALSLAPDIIRAVERNRERREGVVTPLATDRRRFASGVQFSEVEVDTRVPFVRKVTVRKATAWSTDLPDIPRPAPRPRRLRRASLLGISSAFLIATLGLLVNRAGNLPGFGSRRG